MKPGTKIKYMQKKGNGRDDFWKRGKILKQYKHFYLLESENGYRECLNKKFMTIGDIQVEVVK